MECGGSGWLSYCKAVSGALELGVGWKQHETWDNGVWGRSVDSSSDFWATRTFAVQCGFFLFFLSFFLPLPPFLNLCFPKLETFLNVLPNWIEVLFQMETLTLYLSL